MPWGFAGSRFGVLPGRMLWLWENPDFVPKIIPQSEKAAGDELTYLWSNTKPLFHQVQQQVVQEEGVENRVDNVASGGKGNFTWAMSSEYPKPLDEEVQRDTNRITDKIRPK